MNNLNHDALFAFVAFADRLSFTHAARALGISQPALHVKIGKLADELGRPLYHRRGRQLTLTPAGEQLAAFGREAQARAAAIVAEVRGERNDRPVILASGAGAFMHLLGPAIRRYGKTQPLRLVTLPGPLAIEAVATARADLAVAVVDDLPQDERLALTSLTEVGQLVVVPRGHRLATRKRLHARDLDGEALIVPPHGSPHRTMLTQLLAATGVAWRVAVEASGWEVMLHFAACGVGVAVVNDFCTPPRDTVGIALEGAPRRRYSLIRQRHAGTAVRALCDLIHETTR